MSTPTHEAGQRVAETISRWADQLASARRDGDHLRASQFEDWLFGGEVVLSQAGFGELALMAQCSQDPEIRGLQVFLLNDAA